MARLFGTDGVRGLANHDITAELALDLAVAAAHVLAESGEFEGHRPTAVVGTDGRASGEFLSAATVAGLASAGVDVLDARVLPTPAIAFLTADTGADLGVVLSASHNPMPDNGIKFFTRGGHKLPDDVEDAIEARMREPWQRPTGAGVGRVRSLDDGAERYVQRLLSVLPNRLDGLHVVVDAANGAASAVSPEAFRRAGAEVTVIGADPDGLNINDGYGSTHLERLCAAVLDAGADLGIAHDGDADRCLAVDACGQPVDGDQIMAVLAISLRDKGRLPADTLVATVMSNLGMLQAMRREAITVRQTAVGDRYVLEDMKAGGFALGGEQSGHVIFLEHGTTGDGVLTGLMLAARVAETGHSLADLAGVMSRLPQVLVNVRGVDSSRADTHTGVQGDVARASDELGTSGRVLLRKSGTEPLVRVMVEAADQSRAQAVADRLAESVRKHLTLP
ncbi:MAG: phosphoglucosamine mutase [Actinomycetota bacterium]|nr:phosphoglucosamine mutase [Actinomycetota bacterium]